MTIEQLEIGILWWNTYDFYHFEPKKAGAKSGERWPSNIDDYIEKCHRVDTALKSLFVEKGVPSVIALGEITNRAARELRNRILPNYNVISLDVISEKPSLQIAILHAPNGEITFTEAQPLVTEAVPRGTRPMAVLDIKKDDYCIRCVACHWPARFSEESNINRQRVADSLSRYAYQFLIKQRSDKRHLLVFGDFNEEPYDLCMNYLNTHRHRAKALVKHHWTNDDVERVHLYNCAWRFLGERNPHAPGCNHSMMDAAGTYYWSDKSSWHALDQIIVSGGLLMNAPPYIDESGTFIASLSEFMPDGIPSKFRHENGKYFGLSDHLPILTKIVI